MMMMMVMMMLLLLLLLLLSLFMRPCSLMNASCFISRTREDDSFPDEAPRGLIWN
ncbi:hypothetical protein GQ43DRAFT_440417 [Delitschia confertaspora ATCC 74209]|uniref:Secreted protein n=1 Tax=Delitschia confertaspora ATCC 74209 TaxID=1513339 RepID=A0A9P4JLJ2_9PLEO|nr:hypothetical protein GQ43DRAFT_440417 [Delitschia confertaspora ATCC 74209]